MTADDTPPRPERETGPDGDEAAREPGQAGAWLDFDRTLQRIASSAARGAGAAPPTVLLTGESGTGKSRAARRLHDLSSRAAGPFVPVHLAGLAETLLEAELFGHEEGAFTGAARARDGRFVRASGGTVVLEAIETLALPLQVKLLRVLQERVVEPLGASRPVPIDCAVVATTAVDLRQEVAAGRFREDLYFRLAVVPLEVPPLRARCGDEDFAPLCDALVEAVAARASVPPRDISAGAREVLAAHPWPGNVRELENALERVLVVARQGPIEAEELGFLAESTRGRSHEIALEALGAGVSLEALERALLEAALAQTRGNASAAARVLGLSRRAFDYRRKKLSE